MNLKDKIKYILSLGALILLSPAMAQSDQIPNHKLFELSEPSSKEDFISATQLANEQVRLLEKESVEQIQEGLLKQVELLDEMVNALRDQVALHPELADRIVQLEEQAELIREASNDPQIKEKLIAATQALSPKKIDLNWNPDWEKFRKSEYFVTGGMIAGAATSRALFKQSKVRWSGGVGPDDVIRNALRLSDPKARDAVDLATTVGVDALTVWSVLEPLIFASQRKSAILAEQSTLIDIESYASMALLTGLSKSLTARQRPGNGNNESFWSGHTAHAFTSAGLICTHHTYMSLYGNKAADNSACWAAMTMASLVGLGRIASDQHYATDVAVGAAIGLLSGMVLPRILHYKWNKKTIANDLIAAAPAKRKKKSAQFKIEIGAIGNQSIGPGVFIRGFFW